jgi:hypothetical protein
MFVPSSCRVWAPCGVSSGSRTGLLLTALVVAVGGCGSGNESFPRAHPVVEANSVTHMTTPVTEAHAAVRRALTELDRAELEGEALRGALRDILAPAERHLGDLEWFYLPATQAREDILNAYREDVNAAPDRRNAYLEQARQRLEAIASRSGQQLERHLEATLELLTDVETRARAGQDVRSDLERLAGTSQLVLTKAEGVLAQNRFHEPGE